MAYRYASIDEGYSVYGIRNLKSALAECHGLFLRSGETVSSVMQVKDLLTKSGHFNLYDYDTHELEAVKNGESSNKDWTTKIVKL